LDLVDTLGFLASVHLASLVDGLQGGRYLSMVAGARNPLNLDSRGRRH